MKSMKTDCNKIAAEVMQNLPIMTFRLKSDSASKDSEFLYVSEGTKALTGYTEGQSLPKIIHPDDLPTVLRLHEVTVNAGIPLETTTRIITKNGQVKRVWLRIYVTDTDERGMPHIFEGFMADITKLMRVETSELANREKYDFLSRISRDIRTPMNTILGMAEIGINDQTEIKDYTLTIKDAGLKLMNVLNSILDYSKIESGEMKIKPAQYNLASLIHDIVSVGKEWLSTTQLDFEIEIDNNLPSVLYGDMQKIRQAVLNILHNAVKYTDRGQVSLSITGEDDGGKLTLCVNITDTGRGIKEEDINGIFNMFAQYDIVNIEGTGLGLPIAKQLLNLMDGNIGVSSMYGTGSVFIVKIPQMIVDSNTIGDINEVLNSRPAPATAVKFTAPGAAVLIVDDIGTNLKVAKGLLEDYNMRIDMCLSGKEAIRLAGTHNYDLILMDHMMPVMNGMEATRHIRAADPNVPIVALTANAVHGMREMFLSQGFNDFIPKPIDITNLHAVMEKWVPRDKQIPMQSEEKLPDTDFSLKIPGVDTKKGFAMTGESHELYIGILESFTETAAKLSAQMRESIKTNDMQSYAVQVHAVKSLAGTIGADKIETLASSLEAAAKNLNVAYIVQQHPVFDKKLGKLINNIISCVGGK